MAIGPEPTIRPPTIADADGVARVQNDGWRDTYPHLVPERFYDDAALARRTARWTEALGGPEVPPRLRVAEIAGRIVGFVLATPSEEPDRVRDLQLNALYVRTEYHGTGIGQLLLEAAIGTEPAQLWMAKGNPRAHAFYVKHGFRPDGAEQVDEDLDGLLEVRFVR